MATTRTIVVAGAGIGGLTAALTLAAQGYRVVVLEKAERLQDIGAGLQLSPNASRILTDLGLRDAIEPRKDEEIAIVQDDSNQAILNAVIVPVEDVKSPTP